MDILSKDKNQITLIYNSKTSIGKQIKGYASAAKKEVLDIDLSENTLTGTQWVKISDELGVPLGNLINKEHPDFKDKYDSDVELDTNDWIKIINKHPEVIQGWIIIVGDKFYHRTNPSDMVKFMESDSAAISRNPAK